MTVYYINLHLRVWKTSEKESLFSTRDSKSNVGGGSTALLPPDPDPPTTPLKHPTYPTPNIPQLSIKTKTKIVIDRWFGGRN